MIVYIGMASKVTSSTQAHVLRTKRPSGLDMAIVQDLVETCVKVQNGLPAGRSSAAAPPPKKKMEVPLFLEPIPVIDGPMLVDRARVDQEKKMASNASEPLGLDDVSDRADGDLARKCCKRNCFQLISCRV